MIFVKPILEKHNKHASDFVNYICDGKRNLGLEKFAGEEMIVIDSNCGGGGIIYIDERIEHVLTDFLKQK